MQCKGVVYRRFGISCQYVTALRLQPRESRISFRPRWKPKIMQEAVIVPIHSGEQQIICRIELYCIYKIVLLNRQMFWLACSLF
jgi:hypothetical protein